MRIQLTVNGQRAQWEVHPGEMLLDVLRREGYLSVKYGCGEGDCGACTVLVEGNSVRSCLMLAGQVEGKELMTVEGLATVKGLHPIQQSFVDHGAIQCGYCTPGMVLSSKALLDENSTPTRQDVQEALDGNLCRCTGYKKIVEAVLDAAQRLRT